MGFKGFATFALLAILMAACPDAKKEDTLTATGSFKNYYLLENNYSCTTTTGQLIQTYKGKIGYESKLTGFMEMAAARMRLIIQNRIQPSEKFL